MKKLMIVGVLFLAACGGTTTAGDEDPSLTLPTVARSTTTTMHAKPTTTRRTTNPHWTRTCEDIGHEYAAEPGDPHDGDGDGIACEQ